MSQSPPTVAPPTSPLPPLITLSTDFGNRDPFVGIMKGVILSLAPNARLVDLCHEIPPQDVWAGALALEAAVAFFPPGTIHLSVVDPGVGATRRPIAVRTARFTLVGPDNGLLSLALAQEPALVAVTLDNPAWHHQPVSATFHGRDIFAPVTGHLAAGVPLEQLGTPLPVDRLERVLLPEPLPRTHGADLRVLAIDRFGNIALNLLRTQARRLLPATEQFTLDLHGVSIPGPCRTFSDVPEGQPLCYFGSTDRLEIAIRNGHAGAALGAHPGDLVHLHAAH